MTPTARLTHALRSLADALEGSLPCSDPEMPARRLPECIGPVPREGMDCYTIVNLLFEVAHGIDALDALCDAGLCDE